VLTLLLAGLIAVLATRAVRFTKNPEELGGIDERKWFHSAGPVSMPADTFGAVRSSLPPGEDIWLTLPPGWDPGWWGWMARYHLPEQRVAGVLGQGEESEAPAGAWVVVVSPEGAAVVRRVVLRGRRPR